jgi:8-oxo-dGTP diphosphatase
MDTIKVVCGIIYYQNKVLICRRKSSKSLGGFWEFPGGKVEKGESSELALIRELREELEMEVESISYFRTNIHDYGLVKIELIAYKCIFISSDIKLVDHDAIEWVDVNDLSNWNLAPADIPIARELKKNIIFEKD